MKVRTKNIAQLMKEFECKILGDCEGISFDGLTYVIPSNMFPIMGKVIEVEEHLIMGYDEPAYKYYHGNREWILHKEWTEPVDEEIDGLFADMLEEL